MSPSTSFALPSYAKRTTEDFIRISFPILSDAPRQRYRPTVLRYMDVEAAQCDQSFNVGSPWSSIIIYLFLFSHHAHHFTISNDHLFLENKHIQVSLCHSLSRLVKDIQRSWSLKVWVKPFALKCMCILQTWTLKWIYLTKPMKDMSLVFMSIIYKLLKCILFILSV